MKRNISTPFFLFSYLIPSLLVAAPESVSIGERPAVEQHVQGDGMNESLPALVAHGQLLFDARFNVLDGQGRPASTGTGDPRNPAQPPFIRTSGPDANSCFGCHNQPASGGGGEFVVNVFVLAQRLDPVTESVGAAESNERNTLGMFGAGPVEMLAREMSEELIAIREEAKTEALLTGAAASRELVAKGVRFGGITVLPDGRVDPTEIEGVDWDLIVKPFHQKGAVVSLREFTNNAMNHHHGMQSVERFGADTDPDLDGVMNELTIGDITAVTIFQAALATPSRVIPKQRERRVAAARGEQVFSEIGCASCHIPALVLNDPNFYEPNPFNPPGNLRPEDVAAPLSFDMTRHGSGRRLQRLPGGGALVEAFTDLKRHNLNGGEYLHFANELVAQGMLNGFAPPEDFTIDPLPRPLHEFLTRKLWDAGNSDPYGHRGDLTTLTEAIYFHGGEAHDSRDAFFDLPEADQDAVIEFLKTLEALPGPPSA